MPTAVQTLENLLLLGGGFCGPDEALEALGDAHPLLTAAVIAAVIAAVMLAVARRWGAFSILASVLVVAALIAAWNI